MYGKNKKELPAQRMTNAHFIVFPKLRSEVKNANKNSATGERDYLIPRNGNLASRPSLFVWDFRNNTKHRKQLKLKRLRQSQAEMVRESGKKFHFSHAPSRQN